MVYLPGIDGTGLAASRQFPYLADAFDLHALSIPSQDRTPFETLVQLTQWDSASSPSSLSLKAQGIDLLASPQGVLPHLNTACVCSMYDM